MSSKYARTSNVHCDENKYYVTCTYMCDIASEALSTLIALFNMF